MWKFRGRHQKRSEGELQQASPSCWNFFQSLQNTAHEQAKVHEEQLAQLQQEKLLIGNRKNSSQTGSWSWSSKGGCLCWVRHSIKSRCAGSTAEAWKTESWNGRKVKSLTQLYESQLKDNSTEQETDKATLNGKGKCYFYKWEKPRAKK